MRDGRLRWLSRERAAPQPAAVTAGRAVPSWLERLLVMLARTPSEALDWDAVVAIVQEVTGADLVRIWRVTRGELQLVAQRGAEAGVPRSRAIPPDFERLADDAVVAGAPRESAASAVVTAAELEEFRREHLEQILIVPLRLGARVVGRLDLGRRRAEPFGEEAREQATVLAPVLAAALWGRLRGEPDTGHPAELLLAALGTVASAREAFARLLEAVRWRARADAAFLVRWTDDDRPELAVARGEPEALPDPAVLSTSRVSAALRGILERGRTEVLRAVGGLELLFPHGVATVLAVPLPVVIERARGAVLVAWRHETTEGEVVARVVLEQLAPALVGLLAWLDEEERAATANSLARWSSSVAEAFVAASDPEQLSRASWRVVASQNGAVAIALAVRDGGDIVWYWALEGRTLPARRVPLGQLPFWAALPGAPVVRLGPAEREQWQACLPEGIPAHSLLVVPLPSAWAALVAACASEEPSHSIEVTLQRLATLVAPATTELLARAQRAGEPDRRERALAEALVTGESERRQLVETIHTTVLQGLASTLYRIELTLRRADRQPIEETVLELEQVRDRLAQEIAALRDAIFRVRPASLEHLGVVAALRDYASQLERVVGLTVEFMGELPVRPRRELEEILYRIVQTLVERARLPAGITRLVVRVRQQRDGGILLVLADDGKWEGASAWAQLPGVAVVEEWVRLVGGSLHATGLPDGGTAVAISLRADATVAPVGGAIGTNR
ncbi:MAG: GAF domain-containing protein [Thermomicrobium sp.]|nr:GAF domain-containing protein [Thermomicrobium sp.]